MTVVAQPTKQASIYSASFTFSFSFRLLAEADLIVLHVDQSDPVVIRILLLSTDYTVSASPWPTGGTITITAGDQSNFTVGDTVVIYRRSELKQATDYIENDRFPAETHEQTVDVSRMIEQELDEKVSRALIYPIDSAIGSKYDAGSRIISNVLDPESSQDAATRGWVGATFVDLPGVSAGPAGPQFLGLVGTDIGDASKTLTVGVDKAFQLWSTDFTANRTVTLSTVLAYEGAEFNIVRTGGGAFVLDIGGFITVLPSLSGTYTHVKYNGSAWILVAHGKLDGSSTHNLSQLESDGGLVVNDIINGSYAPGDAFRYMTNAQIVDVLSRAITLDVTQAINNAIQSGHGAYITGGTPAIADTIILDGNKSLVLNNSVVPVRIGSSTEPIFHLYGNANALIGTGQVRVKNQDNDHPHGIILVGVHPNDVGGTSDVPTRGFTVQGLKVMGAVGTVENGSPGIYLHSGARRLGGNTSVCYKGVLNNNEIQDCDVGLEFSTDANSHRISGLYINRWINAALWFNAAYGNVINGIMMEWAEIAIIPNNDKRYAIHFNKQNSGVETGTDAAYFADAAFDNSVSGYAELTNGTGGNVGRNIAMLLQNEDGDVHGNNDVHIMGTPSGGIGLDGRSTAETDIGTTNNIETVAGKIHNRGRWRVHGHNIKKLTDGSGQVAFKGSTCRFELNNNLQTSQATQQNLFSWDDIEDAGRVPVIIKLAYSVKVSDTLVTQTGEVIWHARLFSNTSFDSSKVSEKLSILPKGDILLLTPNIVLAAGTDNNTMKVTIGFLTGAVGSLWTFTGSVKLLTTSISLSKVDWKDDISIVIA